MKRTIVAIVAGGLLLAGCSGGGQEVASTTKVASATEVATVSTPPSARDTTLKVGDSLTVYFGPSQADAVVRLLAVDVDPSCKYQYDFDATDAKRGRTHHVALQLEVDATSKPQGFVNAPSFNISEQLPGGFTDTSDAISTEGRSCLPGRPIIDTVDAGTKQRGWLLLGVENASGSLRWDDSSTTGRGYLITYPEDGVAATPATTTTPAPATVDDTPAPPPTTTRQKPTPPAPAPPPSPAPGTFTPPSCPPGTVFSPLGAEPCQSPAEKATIERNEALCGAGHGPADICGPSSVDLDPGFYHPDGTPRSSGEIQGQYAEEQCAAGIKTYCQ